MFVPERGAAALKVTAHCTDLRKRNCLGVPERGRKLLVRAAAVRHVVRLRPRTEPVPSGKQPGTVSAALSVRPAFGSCSHATAATPATSELKPFFRCLGDAASRFLDAIQTVLTSFPSGCQRARGGCHHLGTFSQLWDFPSLFLNKAGRQLPSSSSLSSAAL
nr:uncharacterized protein LOC110356209 isoform X3 [Columba livia]